MMQMQITNTNNYGNKVPETQTEPTVKLEHQQWCGSSGKMEAKLAEDFNLDMYI